MKKILLIFLSVMALSTNAGSITFMCDFPIYVSQTEKDNNADLNIEFHYDTISELAFMKGNNGLSKVMVFNGSDGISFIETLITGAVQTTTIDILSIEEGSAEAVHSRHSILFGLLPSQYYGTCEVTAI